MNVDLLTTYETLTCTRDGCGMVFAVPESWAKARRRDHATWYCPNGHARHWPQRSDVERAQETARYWEGRARDHLARAEQERRCKIAEKAAKTRIKNRVARGVCPCCNRTFADLARHMSTKHPDYGASE